MNDIIKYHILTITQDYLKMKCGLKPFIIDRKSVLKRLHVKNQFSMKKRMEWKTIVLYSIFVLFIVVLVWRIVKSVA